MAERDNASIDELLQLDDDAARGGRATGSSGVAWFVKAALAAAVLAAVVVLTLREFGIGVPYALAVTVLFAPVALHRIVRQVAPVPLPRIRLHSGAADDGMYHWGAMDGLRLSLSSWEIRLDWGSTDLTRFARTTQPALAELVDERLRQRQGFTLHDDPARARALLGEPLWALLTVAADRPLSPRRLAELVTQIERL